MASTSDQISSVIFHPAHSLRLLLIGLPLTIVLGFCVAAVVFPHLEILEMALLAAMLAPTDAALGKPVVTNPTVPAAMRVTLLEHNPRGEGTEDDRVPR